jgi:hypothetical protein
MLAKLLDKALSANGFRCENLTEQTAFYIYEEKSSIRFAVIHKLTEILPPDKLNSFITSIAPIHFKEHSAYKKNCDLICILRLDNLSDFKPIENGIFSIEEDPYQYKKYVLYYTSHEEEILNNLDYNALLKIIADKTAFKEYKENPLASSPYSIAAKIFIKLPFLELPHESQTLKPLQLQANEATTEAEMEILYKNIQNSPEQDTEIESFVTALIEHELENIKNSNLEL